MTRCRSLLPLFVLLMAPAVTGAQGATPTANAERPLVHVDVAVQMDAIERSAAEMSVAVGEIAAALQQIAASGELSVAQQQHLDGIMANLDHVVAVSRQSVDALPDAVARSRASVRAGASEWLAELKLWFFVIIGVVAVLLVVALAAFYWFTLRPLQRTVLQAVSHISAMAQAMANTSKSLEIINQTHREVLRLSGFPAESPPTDSGPSEAGAPPASDRPRDDG